MPVLVRYCNKCGIRIPPLDFEMGKAIEHQGVYYCGKCAEELVVVAEVVEEEEEQQPEPKKASAVPRKHHAVHVDRDRVPHRQTSRDRMPRDEAAKAEYPRPSGSHLPIYLLIIGVFVALVVIILLANRDGGPKKTGGQSGGDSSSSGVDDTGGSGDHTSAGTVDAEEETRLNASLDELGKRTGGSAENLRAAISKLRKMLGGERLPASVQTKATVMLNSYTARLHDLSAEKMKALSERVEDLIKALKFAEALEEIDKFAVDDADEAAARDIDRLKQQAYTEQGAHEKYLELSQNMKTPVDETELPELRSRENGLKKWLKEFEGTVHAGEAAEKLASVESAIARGEQLRRQQAMLKLKKAEEAASELAGQKKFKEAAVVLEEFAAENKNFKDLAKKASGIAAAYRKQAAESSAAVPTKPKEPRFRLDFTGEKVVADLKYKHNAAAVKSSGGVSCLSMPAPEASVLRVDFEIEALPERLILGLEHAGEKPPPGRSLKARVDIKVNGKNLALDFEVTDEFKINHFDILKFLKKGANSIEISPSRKSEITYLVRKLGMAEKHSDVFKPLEEGKEDTTRPDKTAAGGAKGEIFNGKNLDGWKSLGSGSWEVKEGVITGKHTGKGNDVGFVFPMNDAARKWYEYKVSFEVWCNVAGGWQVALRAREGTGGLVSTNVLNASSNFTEKQWWKISLRLSGGSIYASVDGGEEFEFKKDPDKLPGTFAFGVKPGAVVKFRNVKFELTKSK
jgi:hypothetical protein